MKKTIFALTILLASALSFSSEYGFETKALINSAAYLHDFSKVSGIFSVEAAIYKNIIPSDKVVGFNLGAGLEIGGRTKNAGPDGIISPYLSLEINKKVSDSIVVLGGLNVGSVTFFGHKTNSTSTQLKIKTYAGFVYHKYFTMELGVGYPGAISLGIGMRYGF
ncbi:hypothetical protein [Caviibacter abscessus]|uniref:hypothetical protein n=1 Tax=Caviibacter abscessus TaxID=1766719 RepID=UPI00082F4EB6|nr:hypothetical protein [Caviibacter abscessus]